MSFTLERTILRPYPHAFNLLVNSMPDPTTTDWDLWKQVTRLAASAPDLENALQGILGEVLARTGASGGAVLQLPQRIWLGAQRCEADELRRLASEPGGVARALERLGDWSDAPLVLARSAEQPHLPGDSQCVLLAPIQMRAVEVGVLVLLFADARTPPSATVRTTAQCVAALLAPILEHERLAEELRRTERARHEFLAALNHELRTPATALVLDSFVVRSGMYGELPTPLRKSLEQIESHVEWLVGVLEGVLDLSGADSVERGDNGDIIQPREAVLELLRKVEPAAKKKELPILFFSPRTLPVLQTDLSAFSRILLHLFSNAIKYTSEGRIEVRLEQGSRPVHRRRRETVLVIRVIDTGSGIPPEEQERVFEPFAQVGDGARSDSHVRGAGLGLAVARNLARSLRGEIRIDSTVGTGTTVTFLIPYLR